MPELRDVGSDRQAEAPTLAIRIDRAAASLYGVLPATIDETLYDAFGHARWPPIPRRTDTFHVVLEVLPNLQRDIVNAGPALVRSSGGTLVPLSWWPNMVDRWGLACLDRPSGQSPARHRLLQSRAFCSAGERPRRSRPR